MKNRFSPYLIVLLLVSGLNSYAQNPQIFFNPILGNDGIFLGKINSIAQDPQGYIWLSDQDNGSIIRYDGSRMISYKYDQKNPNSLGGSYPECLFADPTGIIWIGFYGTGLDRFDQESGKFTHFRHRQGDPTSLGNDTVASVLMDKKGNLWIGTYGGLDYLDQATGKFTHYSHSDNDPSSLSCNKIRIIYQDRQGTLWIGTGNPFVSNNEGGLNRFDPINGKFIRYIQNPNDPQSLSNNKIRAIFEDSRGTFWVGTAGSDGLHTMDRSGGVFVRHLYDPKKPEKLSRPPVKKDDKYDHITYITEDGKGAIWIGTFSQGILHYDPLNQTLTHFSSNEKNASGFKDDSGWCALVSREGVFWISTQEKNLYRVDPFRNSIPHFKTPATTSFYEDQNSTFWYGTGTEGLFRQDPGAAQPYLYKNDPRNKNSISINNANSIYKDRDGDLWLGSWGGGINRLNPATGKFTHFRHDPKNNKSLSSDNIIEIYRDRHSDLWIGTTNGCDVLDPGTGYFKHYLNNSKDTNSISRNSTTCFLDDSQNNFWVGTWDGGGVNLMNRQNGKFKHYLFDESVNNIYEDSQNDIWVGTTSGIFQYNRKSDKFSQLDEKRIGFHIPNAWGIIEDKEHNLWFSSGLGIVRLNSSRDKISIFGKNNGVNGGSLWYQTGYISPRGYLYYANADGYYSFQPEKLSFNTFAPSIILNSFWIAGKPINPSSRGPFQHSLAKSTQIHLKYNQNAFSIGLNTIDFSNPEDSKILYRLKNFDRDWLDISSDGKASYYDVPPGKYILEVKAFNSNNGIRTEKAVEVIISPPFWETWTAYLVYLLLFIAGIFGVDRFQRRRLLQAERERTRDRELAQAKEIEKAYTELKTTQAQLIQSEKMASLGELTAGIAHEIQNPLNFVNNFSEVNKELIAEMRTEIDRGNMAEVKAIAMDIEENEEKILQHGKRADAIVKGMLQHSRSSSGIKEPANINAIADEYLRLAYHGLRAKDKSFNATMKTNFDQSIGYINIIPQDIGRVILNLITNAFYAVDEKKKTLDLRGFENIEDLSIYEPTVTVQTSRLPPLGRVGVLAINDVSVSKVLLSVKDNGNGILQKNLDKIFQPFFTTKPSGEGTGLGLSLSYEIITKGHGGELKVITKEGEFTEFIIIL